MSASALDDVAAEGTHANRFRVVVARALRGGAILAATFLLLGLLRYATLGRVVAVDTRLRDPVATIAFLTDLRRGDPLALCTLGVLVLVGLPIARVILSFFYFLSVRDRLYSLLTGVVLALVFAGTLLGRAL